MQHDSNFAADNEKADSLESGRLVLRQVCFLKKEQTENKTQTSLDEIVEMTSSNGSVFFIRVCYLQLVSIENIMERVSKSNFPGAVFSEEESEDILRAGFAFSAERKAGEYLGRCEQSRFGLTQKLLQKGFNKKSVELALDRLEQKNYLSDARYAYLWIRGHCMTKFQGKTRLLAELMTRGIAKTIASQAINDFFSGDWGEINNTDGVTEESMCEKAYQKGVRQKKSGDKLLKFLIDSGFPYKMAISTINNHKNSN